MLELQERALATRARGRFKVSLPEPYQLDRSTIMSMINAATPPDRSGAFAELAQRERVAQALRRLGARGSRDFCAPPY